MPRCGFLPAGEHCYRASLPTGVGKAGVAIVEVSHLHRRYGAFHGGRGRDLRLARPQRRWQDDDRGEHRRAPRAGRRGYPGARPRSARGPRRAARAGGRAAAGERPASEAANRRGPVALRLLLPAPGRPGAAHGDPGPVRQARDVLQGPLGRTEAATVDRARPDRAADDRGAGRADDRAGPASPARHLGPGQGGA